MNGVHDPWPAESKAYAVRVGKPSPENHRCLSGLRKTGRRRDWSAKVLHTSVGREGTWYLEAFKQIAAVVQARVIHPAHQSGRYAPRGKGSVPLHQEGEYHPEGVASSP